MKSARFDSPTSGDTVNRLQAPIAGEEDDETDLVCLRRKFMPQPDGRGVRPNLWEGEDRRE